MNESPSTSLGKGRLDWQEIAVLYRHEVRTALRDKTIFLCSVLLPIFLFPFVLWAAFSGLMFMQGQTHGFVSRISIRAWPQNHRVLRDQFERDEQLKVVETGLKDATNLLQRGEIDAVVEFRPATGPAAILADNFTVQVLFDESKERSAAAKQRIIESVGNYRNQWLKREAVSRGIDTAKWREFGITSKNVATKKQMGAFLMGLMLPILFVVMVSMGCFYPAVDTLAGERERNTWETLMSTAASRISVVTAKYLYVVSMGGLAGTLNVLAIVLTIKPILAPLTGSDNFADFTMPLGAIPIIAVAALLLGGLIGAIMLILGSFARTFAEGQAVITPFYSVIPLPLLFLQIPGLQFTSTLALIPVVNITMMVRSALMGVFPLAPIAITLAESLMLIYLCLRLSGLILDYEDFVSGSFSGGILGFLKQRRKSRSPHAALTP